MKPDLNLGDTQLIIKECRMSGLSRPQAAYILATSYWETARTMKPVKEAYWVKNAEGWRKRNLRYWPWYGRGYVQLTWERNYKFAGTKLDLDLTTNPDVVMNPEIAAKILVTGSEEGWFTSRKLDDYINLTKKDYIGARRIINGTDKAGEIAKIALSYEAALEASNYEIGFSNPEIVETLQPERVMAESTTIRAQTRQWGATALGFLPGVYAAFNAQDPMVKAAMVGVVGVALILVAHYGRHIISERMKYWMRGVQ